MNTQATNIMLPEGYVLFWDVLPPVHTSVSVPECPCSSLQVLSFGGGFLIGSGVMLLLILTVLATWRRYREPKAAPARQHRDQIFETQIKTILN